MSINTLEILQTDTLTKHLVFRLIEQKPKTGVYAVMTKEKYPVDSSLHQHHLILGYVKFKPHWRQYIYQTTDEITDIASSCMVDINDFITKLNKELRKRNRY